MTVASREQVVPGRAVFSGPAEKHSDCAQAFIGLGLAPAPLIEVQGPDGVARVPEDQHAHGLPSHASPEAAEAAGAPNAGHTPGTPHPDTGGTYERDPKVDWIAVELPEDAAEALADLQRAATDHSYALRMHTSPSVRRIEEITVEQRLERVEADMAAIRHLRGEA